MKFKFCQVGMGADDTQFASAFPSTKEALVKELGQQNLVNAIVQNLGVDPKDKSAFKRLDGFIRGEIRSANANKLTTLSGDIFDWGNHHSKFVIFPNLLYKRLTEFLKILFLEARFLMSTGQIFSEF